MKDPILILIICFSIFVSCSKDENNPEINIKKNDLSGQKNIQKENRNVENNNFNQHAPLQTITSKEVKTHVGDSLIIKGFVADIFLSDKVAYLNFENKFPKNIFSCAIFSGRFEEFGDLSRFKNKIVEVSGKILTYKNKPQVILNSKDQIKIVSDE